MTNSFLLLGLVLIPVIFAFICLFLRDKISKIISLIGIIISLIFILLLLKNYFSNFELQKIVELYFYNWEFFVVDSYAVVIAVTSTIVGLLIVLYSFGYMKEYERQNEYYFYVTLFVGSMLGLVFSGNLVVMYVFWEITSICSWQLIGFYRKPQHLSFANKAFFDYFIWFCVDVGWYFCSLCRIRDNESIST